ncbi:hypothetical protein [Sorangium sp. So ce1000]
MSSPAAAPLIPRAALLSFAEADERRFMARALELSRAARGEAR